MAQRPDDIPNIRMDVSGQAESVVQIGQAGTVNQYITRTHRPITPRQLPATSSHFLNRTEELAALNAIVEVDESRPAPRVILLDGEMGVGRTNLATRWGRPLKDRFPHGTIYCDIDRYRHADTVNLIEVLTKLLRSLQVPEDTMFGDIEGQVDLWRSVTDELSLLVVSTTLRNRPTWST
ncbi:hypothetical protein ACFQ3B_07690 [Stackebrandtia endophytica]|uniref:hypothetical protein n=1 Tax=Stackebrandtia endophytica TaxID=1496996 RepID=UPI001153446F|nr:hypothetical protein [Stackebrandtia endophytica]